MLYSMFNIRYVYYVYIYLIREIFYFRNDGLSLAYQKRNKKIVKVDGRASVIVELTQFNFRSLDSLRSNKSRMTDPPLTRKISQKYVTEALSTPVIKNQKRSQQGCSHQSQLCLISQAWSDDTDGG